MNVVFALFAMSLTMSGGDEIIVRADRNVCGSNSLLAIIYFLGGSMDRRKLDSLLPVEKAPFSMRQLNDAAVHLGYITEAYHFENKNKISFEHPAILHIKKKDTSMSPDHFMACVGETTEGLVVVDFPRDPFLLDRQRLFQIWDGDALFIVQSKNKKYELMYFLESNGFVFGIAFVAIASVLPTINVFRKSRNA